jgi:adenylate kinase
MKLDVIFMTGQQGSGKGTQSKLLADQFGFFHWEMGAIFREERDWVLKTGHTVGELIDHGTLMSDEQTIEVFEAKIHLLPQTEPIIFDGIPRRRGQAEEMVKFLRANNRARMATVFLDIDDTHTFERLAKRKEIEGRADDNPDAIARRLAQFREATMPMLEYLKQETHFVSVDGRPAIPQVYDAITQALQAYL